MKMAGPPADNAAVTSTHYAPPPPRIALVTVSAAHVQNKTQAALALKDKHEYCNRHGYGFHIITQTVPGRDAAWAKLPGILSLLHRYDWIVNLDFDTLIFDHTVRA